ncbi:hypothetical protein K443DRAFT_8752 [Laccaria amethystina LaAM-08-1]|uniref:Uncharacterized protein n=1 Tax=Laccaria amethystina LaAM-08-1 TaxID=1095629 RepID=A0A0C9X1X9_9AGAR|nr:hypothetical protein K443DRAFT_15143 [Laccaria amethystina LaAM-08-1]KIJ99020.1 hypothetical protein K443DRAFT_8752 [Laccaria amethystina LaAM-08-1]
MSPAPATEQAPACSKQHINRHATSSASDSMVPSRGATSLSVMWKPDNEEGEGM